MQPLQDTFKTHKRWCLRVVYCTIQFAVLDGHVLRFVIENEQPLQGKGCLNSLDWTTGLDYWTGLLD